MPRDLLAEKRQPRDLLAAQGPSAAEVGAEKVAEDINPLEALGLGFGRGARSLLEVVGLADEMGDEQALAALRKAQPIATGAGEIIGQAAPFAAAPIGAIPSVAGRIAAGGALGAAEGGVIAAAEDQDLGKGAGIGLSVGAGLEAAFPVVSRIGRALFTKLRGRPPANDLIDSAGRPTPELQSVLDESGMTMEDLTASAQDVIAQAGRGADPEQVARAARFADEGVPITQGELTQKLPQQAVEARLIESATDTQAEPFRQFKLRQSEAIRNALEQSVDVSKIPEETGEAIKSALEGRKTLLRTTKNELYKTALENAKDAGGIPLFADGINAAVPDERALKRLSRVSGGKTDDVLDTLAEFGIGVREGIEDIEPLSVQNFEDLRSALLGIQRTDQSGGVSVLVGPVIDALDDEVLNLADRAIGSGLAESVIAPLKEARKVTRQLKTEFSPQSVTGNLVGVKRDGATPLVEASKVYNKLSSKAMPVENVRRAVASLKKAGDKGATALVDLQNTTMLDLIDAGFSTATRKIDGVPAFNAGAFNKRIESLGKDKLSAIFSGNPAALKKIKNIESIARDIQPPSAAVPKGSGMVILDLANKLGLLAFGSKLPIAGALLEGASRLQQGGANRVAVQKAINASPDAAKQFRFIQDTLPNVAIALGITQTQDENAQ